MTIEDFAKSLQFKYIGQHMIYDELPVLIEEQYCIKYSIISNTFMLGSWDVGQILVNLNGTNNFELLPLANSLLQNKVKVYVWDNSTYINSFAFKAEILRHLKNQICIK